MSQPQKTHQLSQLDQLKQYTTVVADTGNFAQIAAFAPRDATTNPSLILKAVQNPQYENLLQSVILNYSNEDLSAKMDRLVVLFGCEILKVINGRVSTEVDARLSFDTEGTIERAHRIMALYQQAGIDNNRVLIKIAATWEGIAAARELEKVGIHTNLTLLFSFEQACACADANVTLISPFVGRIYDWYKAKASSSWVEADHARTQDPGVQSVANIYHYYKKFGIKTEVMGASFRNVGQILALAGCDLLTISPELLEQLQQNNESVQRELVPASSETMTFEKMNIDEKYFRFALNENAMASEKLAEGIRAFTQDARKLEALITSK